MTIVPHPFAFHRQVLAFATLFAILPLPTQALTLPVINDASVSSAKPSTASGNTPKLLVDAKHSALLSFSDASLPTGITSTHVAKATLRVWVNLKKGPDPEVIELHTVPSNWNERQVTYANAPSATGTPIATRQLSAITPGNWLEIDITESVKSHLDNPSTPPTPAAFRIQPALAVSKASVSFDSKENTGTGHAAWIDLELTAGTKGDMQWWNGSAWVMIPAGTHNTTLKSCNGVPTWVVTRCEGFAIGDTGPAGGIVFYLTDNTGQHGLEAAPVDQSTAATWGCVDTSIIGAAGTDVGTGAANTKAIIAAGCGVAAKLADAYILNSYDDWFLPSKDELNLMYTRIGQGALAPFTNVGGFVNDYYWSSTSSSNLSAWCQDFLYSDYSDKFELTKNFPIPVRAVRAF